jgi:Skp family chaperone for outer membrane proteins
MKRILFATTVFVLLTGPSISASAQIRPGATGTAPAKPAAPQPTPVATANVPNTKIALIDTTRFSDEKAGITRYLNAIKTVQREFQPRTTELAGLQTRIKAIADEITKLSGNTVVSPQSIQTKRDEGERLQRELKYKKEQADADFEKRYNEVVGPISSDIGKALEQYANQHGITMVLDVTKLLPALLTANPAMDITRAFITEYNGKNP